MSIRVLSKELQEKAKAELNEVPERLQEDLKHIRDWIDHQPHLKAKTDDQWLLSFLRGCKFSLQKTKEKIETYYTMRTALPEFYSNRDPFQPEIQEMLKLGVFLPLPKTRDEIGPRVILARSSPTDPYKHSFITTAKVGLMIFDILTNEDDHFIIGGQDGIFDINGLSFQHILQLTPAVVKKIVYLQHAYPMRPRNLFVLNSSSIFESTFHLACSLTSEKIRKRIQIYNNNNLDAVCKLIPKKILPKEYGGEGGSVDEIIVEWKSKVESYRDWFLQDAQYGTIEEKREKKSQILDQVFGVEGSFRKLNID